MHADTRAWTDMYMCPRALVHTHAHDGIPVHTCAMAASQGSSSLRRKAVERKALKKDFLSFFTRAGAESACCLSPPAPPQAPP